MKTTLMAHLSLAPYKESVKSVQIPRCNAELDAPSALRAAHMLLIVQIKKGYTCGRVIKQGK